MSRVTIITLSTMAVILFALFLHREWMFQRVGGLVEEEMALAHGPEVWSAAQDGVQVSFRVRGLKGIQFSSGSAIEAGPMGRIYISHAMYQLPPPGTKPQLLVEAKARNVSDRTVYLIGDKTRSGIEGPAFLRICLRQGTVTSEPLKIHTAPFERQQAEELRPGQWLFYLEYIPYDELVPQPPDMQIVGMISIVHTEPAHGSHVPPDSVAYSEPVPIPTHLFQHYFNVIW